GVPHPEQRGDQRTAPPGSPATANGCVGVKLNPPQAHFLPAGVDGSRRPRRPEVVSLAAQPRGGAGGVSWVSPRAGGTLIMPLGSRYAHLTSRMSSMPWSRNWLRTSSMVMNSRRSTLWLSSPSRINTRGRALVSTENQESRYAAASTTTLHN